MGHGIGHMIPMSHVPCPCPMSYALCPMPYALCPLSYAYGLICMVLRHSAVVHDAVELAVQARVIECTPHRSMLYAEAKEISAQRPTALMCLSCSHNARAIMPEP